MKRALRVSRVVTFVYFVLNGVLLGMWVVQIPAVEERVGISHAALGGFLVLLGAGAFAGMQVGGRLSDRLGTRTVVPAAGVLCSVTLVLPGLAQEPWALAVALLVFGFGNGTLDVSMNAHAVQVEKAYERPVMSAFHATFSVGGVLAALAGAVAIDIGWNPATTLGAAAAIGVITVLVSARGLLPAEPAAPVTSTEAEPAGRSRSVPTRIWLLAVLALLIMLCEGAANDWSVLHLKTVLGAPESTAAFAYGTYAATMTIGRLLADRISARFGPVAVLRYGSALAAVGITVVTLSPWISAALTGWALFGLGLSGCIPQLFSAAGHADPGAAGTNVSRVAGLGYIGMLAGPAVIGWMTHLMALNHTFLLLTLFCVTAAAAAGVLRPSPERSRVVELTP
ncbi:MULTISPECIES: MFS transporter [unclassified Streptomyces]|uniref:MFS transporter n=1 Tax=unclassified Streptomyces TaxID=2593676 RepID=UPI0004CCDBF1|nr:MULTISPECIES: MFS transporter [unclassified Streptomyces]KOV77360.1 MFS transporter [Streptomyces sp. NRRL WC-3723]